MLSVRPGSGSYVRHGYVRRRLAFIGLLVLLTSVLFISMVSLTPVDSTLMLQVVPTKSARVFVLSVRPGSRSYVCHGYVRRRLAFIGLLVLLTSVMLISMVSLYPVDSALMLQVAPTKSAFSMDW